MTAILSQPPAAYEEGKIRCGALEDWFVRLDLRGSSYREKQRVQTG